MQYDCYCSCVGEDAETRKTGSEGVRSGNIPHDAREMSRWAEVTTGKK